MVANSAKWEYWGSRSFSLKNKKWTKILVQVDLNLDHGVAHLNDPNRFGSYTSVYSLHLADKQLPVRHPSQRDRSSYNLQPCNTQSHMPQIEFIPRPHVCRNHITSSRPIPQKTNPVARDLQNCKVWITNSNTTLQQDSSFLPIFTLRKHMEEINYSNF